MGPEVDRIVEAFKTDQSGRRTRFVRNLELYEGRSMGGYSAHGYMEDGSTEEALSMDRLRLVRSAVSYAVASVYAPQKPKPQFQTLGATWDMRRKAYRLDRICEGILNQRQERFVNVWAFMIDAGVDAILQGVAPIKVVADRQQRRIYHELVSLPDLFVDPAEGRTPQNLFQRAPIDQSTALARFPDAKKEIEGAKDYDWFGRAATLKKRASKIIEIQYGWRLPISEEEPGKWCAVIGGKVVEEGPWTAPTFPFVWLVWEPHRDGYWASGVADEGHYLAEEAGEVDLRLMHRGIVASGKKIYYDTDAGINPNDLATNEAVTAVPMAKDARVPTETLVPPFSEVEISFLESKKRAFWDAIGISQVSAAARREQGVQSGIAMLTLNDTKAGRQLVKAQRYEQAYVDLAHQYVWRLRELAEEDPDFVVKWPGKALLRTYKFADADIDDESFSVSVAPSSALPHDPAGRQEMVQQMYGSGLISQETARSLIGWADLDSELNMQNAESDYIDATIERYLEANRETWNAGDYQSPVAWIFNKTQAMRRFGSAWFRARIDQQFLPREEQVKAEFNIELLARFIKELDKLMQPPPAPPGQGAPQQGGPPPTDQLAAPPVAQAA